MSRSERQHACARGHGPFAPDGTAAHYPPDPAIEVAHLDLDLRVDVPARTLVGDVTLHLRARRTATRLDLDAVDLRDVTVEGAAASYDGRVIALGFDPPLVAGEAREVRVHYRAVEPSAGLSFSSPSDHDPSAPTFAVTDHETERARHWLPTVDHPSVRPTLRFRITADARFTVLANGVEVARTDHADGSATVEFRLDQPCPSYLTCFVVGDFVEFDGGQHGGVPIRAYAPRGTPPEALARTFQGTASMLTFFESKLGASYPYPKYAQFAVPGIGGAMENISLVSWDDRFLLDDGLELEEQDLADIVNVHEMAHAWFGDHLTCRDASHAWLKESFATYAETLYLEDTVGAEAAELDRLRCRDAYLAEHDGRYARPLVTRIYESSWDLFDAHLYPGGALRLHMLRRLVGDEAFFASLRAYVARHGGGLVETDDFRRVVEATSHHALEAWFDLWIRTPGPVELDVTAAYDPAARTLELTTTRRKPSLEATGRLAVWVDTESGARHAEVPFGTGRSTVVLADVAAPRAVVFDPSGDVLARLHHEFGTPWLAHAAAHAPTPYGRVDALRRLVASGTHAAYDALEAALAAEPSWGVRGLAYAALGDAVHGRAQACLLTHTTREVEPRARVELLRALGHHRGPDVAPALRLALDAGLPPRAREAALEGLGRQRDPSDLPRLVAALDAPRPHAFTAAGAARGLAAAESEVAVEALLTRLPAGRGTARARPAIARALPAAAETSGPAMRTRIERALLEAVADPDRAVRAAAAGALVTLATPAGLEAARAHARGLCQQDRVRLERTIAAAAAPAEARFAALTKRLESLERAHEALERAHASAVARAERTAT